MLNDLRTAFIFSTVKGEDCRINDGACKEDCYETTHEAHVSENAKLMQLFCLPVDVKHGPRADESDDPKHQSPL